MVLWIKNSEVAAAVVVILFTQEQIWRGLQIQTQREKEGLYNKQEQS